MQVENTNIRGSKWPKDTKGCFWLQSYGHSQSQQTKISQLISTTNINKPPSPSSLSQETTISLLKKVSHESFVYFVCAIQLTFLEVLHEMRFWKTADARNRVLPMGKVCPLQDSVASFSDHAWIGRAHIRTEVSTLLHGFVMFLCALMVLLFRNSVLAKCIGVATSMLLLRLQT
jgi:hypothetical protein